MKNKINVESGKKLIELIRRENVQLSMINQRIATVEEISSAVATIVIMHVKSGTLTDSESVGFLFNELGIGVIARKTDEK